MMNSCRIFEEMQIARWRKGFGFFDANIATFCHRGLSHVQTPVHALLSGLRRVLLASQVLEHVSIQNPMSWILLVPFYMNQRVSVPLLQYFCQNPFGLRKPF